VLDPIRPVRLADTIAERIQTMILEGALKPGEKLVAERDLAEALGVSRPSLREGLAILEEKGLLTTTKSGTTVARFLNRLSDPLSALLADDERVSADYFEYRLAVETEATALAARRANNVDRAAIHACLERMSAAHASDDTAAEADSDVSLHGLVYEASHNVLILHIMTVLGELTRKNTFYSREQLYRRAGVREMLLAQHLAIGDAILKGDPIAAERAAAYHIRFTQATIAEIRLDEMRLAASLRRFERADIVHPGRG
jgi:GntR family transcriptional regulator, transcriptional repressor for pyruvate dehydrogenase complex